jgi:hypothetical protein
MIQDYKPLLIAVLNLVHRNLIKNPEGDHYYELMEAIQNAVGGDPVDELINAMSSLEVAVETLTKSPLLDHWEKDALYSVYETLKRDGVINALRR